MKAYSQDLRKRIVETVEGGLNKRATTRRFEVSLNTVKHYVEQTSQLEPHPLPGRPATFTPQKLDLDLLKAQIALKPDATLFEIFGQSLSKYTKSRLSI